MALKPHQCAYCRLQWHKWYQLPTQRPNTPTPTTPTTPQCHSNERPTIPLAYHPHSVPSPFPRPPIMHTRLRGVGQRGVSTWKPPLYSKPNVTRPPSRPPPRNPPSGAYLENLPEPLFVATPQTPAHSTILTTNHSQ